MCFLFWGDLPKWKAAPVSPKAEAEANSHGIQDADFVRNNMGKRVDFGLGLAV